MKTKLLLITSVLFLLIGATPCHAQWISQEIPLVPGWNAVHLNVEPATSDCESVFAGIPVQSVGMWSRRQARLQFTTDPEQLLPRNPDWLYWMPSSNPQSLLNSLFSIHGNQSYLIRLHNDAAPITWRIKGTPVPFRRHWMSESLNLTGLPVPPGTATFENFFRSSTAIQTAQTEGGEIFQVNGDGESARVWQPARTKLQPGVAYWIRCQDATRYAGPLRVELDFGRVLEFEAGIWTRRLEMANESQAAMTVQVRLWPSETPPPGTALLAGGVPLSYREKEWSQGMPREVFKPLAPSVSRTLAPGETWTLELTPRRQEMSEGAADTYSQSLLEITDGETVQQWIGVRAQ